MTDRDLVVTAVTGGSTYPSGTTSYTGATNVIVYAIPDRGNILSGWTFNTAALTSKASRLTVALNAGTNTLLPAFTAQYTVSNSSLYSDVKDVFRLHLGVENFNVTLHAFSLGAQDSDTGIPAKTYTDSTIEMMIVTKESRQISSQIGKYVYLDALGITASYVRAWDKITTATGKNYFVNQATPQLDGAGQLVHYEVSLMEEKLQ